MNLSNEQSYALKKFQQRANLFVTGPGGTGKTRLIEELSQHCKHHRIKYQVCALTGCATMLLPKGCNARTIHSWSGIRLCKGDNNKIVETALKSKRIKSNWKSTQVLIVDEVSMMSSKVLQVLHTIAQRARNNTLPFGGLQVVFLGDFYQLPPIGTAGDEETEKFCFENLLWPQIFPLDSVVVLNTIFRQSDPQYKEILLQVRDAKLSKDNAKVLESLVDRPFDAEKYNGCTPTKLFPTRAKTDHVNSTMFSKLTGKMHVFHATKKTHCKYYIETNTPLSLQDQQKCSKLHESVVEYELNALMATSPFVESLHVKKGAAVMCTVNLDMDNGICNGAQGMITNMVETDKGVFPEVTFTNGVVKTMEYHYVQSEEYPSIAIGQIPLCLAWALTIHKIQGATLTMADMDVGSQIFEYGQTYVALSRVQSLEGLYLSAFNAAKIRVNPIVQAFYESLPERDYVKLMEEVKTKENPFQEYELVEEEYEEEAAAPVKKDIKVIKL